MRGFALSNNKKKRFELHILRPAECTPRLRYDLGLQISTLLH